HAARASAGGRPRTGVTRGLRSLRTLPGLRRPHAPCRRRRPIASRPLSMRHVMTTTGGPISNLLVSRRRYAIALPALILDASFNPQPLPSPLTQLPPSPSEPSKRPSPHVRTARHPAAPTFPPQRQAAKANQPRRFPHSG